MSVKQQLALLTSFRETYTLKEWTNLLQQRIRELEYDSEFLSEKRVAEDAMIRIIVKHLYDNSIMKDIRKEINDAEIELVDYLPKGGVFHDY